VVFAVEPGQGRDLKAYNYLIEIEIAMMFPLVSMPTDGVFLV
jgi:hypothetical protein